MNEKVAKQASGCLSGLISVAAGSILFAGVMGLERVTGCVENTNPEHLMPIVAKAADTNKDGNTDEKEWIVAYKEMNVPYNALSPELPSSRQMIDYLKKRNISY